MIPKELLQKFCATTHDQREFLRAPWRVGDVGYATNGHFCVRLDSVSADITEGTERHPGAFCEKLFSSFPESGAVPIPEIPPPKMCDTCQGRGVTERVECDECEGGQFRHGSWDYDCLECKATGFVYGSKTNDVPFACPDCDGFGELSYQRTKRAVKIGAAIADPKYVRVISQLPNVAVFPGNNPMGPIAFCFEGGRGLLMPLRM